MGRTLDGSVDPRHEGSNASLVTTLFGCLFFIVGTYSSAFVSSYVVRDILGLSELTGKALYIGIGLTLGFVVWIATHVIIAVLDTYYIELVREN